MESASHQTAEMTRHRTWGPFNLGCSSPKAKPQVWSCAMSPWQQSQLAGSRSGC